MAASTTAITWLAISEGMQSEPIKKVAIIAFSTAALIWVIYSLLVDFVLVTLNRHDQLATFIYPVRRKKTIISFSEIEHVSVTLISSARGPRYRGLVFTVHGKKYELNDFWIRNLAELETFALNHLLSPEERKLQEENGREADKARRWDIIVYFCILSGFIVFFSWGGAEDEIERFFIGLFAILTLWLGYRLYKVNRKIKTGR